MNEQRIIELEERVAYQEQALFELNQALTDQQAQLTRLREVLATLNDRLEAVADGNTSPTDERPPHY